MIRLAECTWPKAQQLARDERALVILPLGAVEQHGPHLPLLVDWLGAEEIARRIAPHLTRAGYRVVLAPSLPYGASPLAERWPGTVSLSRATLVRVIVEVVRALARHGFRRFVLANYQADGEHLRAMAEARRRLARRPGALRRVQPGRRRAVADGEPARPRAHAEPEARSRVALGRARDRADAGAPAGPGAARRWRARCRPRGWTFARALARGARRFEEIAPGGAGYFGWPAAARARTAERVMRLRGRADRPRAARGARASARAPRRSTRPRASPRARRPTPRVAMAARRTVVLPRAASPRGWYCSAVGRGRGCLAVARGRGKECS